LFAIARLQGPGQWWWWWRLRTDVEPEVKDQVRRFCPLHSRRLPLPEDAWEGQLWKGGHRV